MKSAVKLKEGCVKMADDKAVAPKKEAVPSDIADQLQTAKNEKAAADYEKRKAGVPGKKKGGCVKMARGGGIEVRGKTKGRFV